MPEVVHLPLRTTDSGPLMHKFYSHEGEAEGLLIAFPGDNYGVDGPLLYYPAKLLRSEGWDTLAITYGYQTKMEAISLETIPGLIEECLAAVRYLLSEGTYVRVGLVGKSLGASVVAHLCQVESGLHFARSAFLNPPLGHPFFDATFRDTRQDAYLATGTADRFFNTETLESLRQARPYELTVIEHADHSMDVPGDLKASLQAVERVVEEVVAFLTRD
ncbi:MAG: hypothetical protein GTO14_20575 [Anaerolineales bacterium]|nr:hypothetical protein [Anaerolineales bacterium]